MRLKEEVMDLVDLDDTFNLSRVWGIHNQLINIKSELETLIEGSIQKGNLSEAAEHEIQLYYVKANLYNTMVVMLAKEGDIFEFEEFSIACKN